MQIARASSRAPSIQRNQGRLSRVTVAATQIVTGEGVFMLRIALSKVSNRAVVIAASLLLPASSAWASQGPGIGAGTASATTQLAMAVIVYGASALAILAGAVGALRHR
jgi:hypothetical protein